LELEHLEAEDRRTMMRNAENLMREEEVGDPSWGKPPFVAAAFLEV